MVMDWLYPERAKLREENENLRRENKKLWTRVQGMETRMDAVGIDQFLFIFNTDENTMSSTKNTLKRFGIWVTR